MRPTVYCVGDLLQVPVDIAVTGDHVIVPGLPEKIIKVHRLKVIAATSVALTFKSDTTPLSGPEHSFGQILDIDLDNPWYTTAPGEDFVMELGADIQMGGTVWYSQPAVQVTS